MPVVPSARRSGPEVLGPVTHDVRTLRRRPAKGLFGRGDRLQGQRLLQERQPQGRYLEHTVDHDPRGNTRKEVEFRHPVNARTHARGCGVDLNVHAYVHVHVHVDVIVIVRLSARDCNVLDGESLTGGAAREPLLVTADVDEVEQHPLERRRHGDFTNRFRQLSVANHQTGDAD